MKNGWHTSPGEKLSLADELDPGKPIDFWEYL
jgi:hypothetical protein